MHQWSKGAQRPDPGDHAHTADIDRQHQQPDHLRAGAIAQHDADRQRIAAEAACAVWADGRINDGAAMWLVADELGVPSGVLAGWLAEYVEGGEA